METLNFSSIDVSKMLWFTVAAFLVSFSLTPLFTEFLFKHRLGKRIRDSKSAPIFAKMHAKKQGTPTMAGLLIWIIVAIITIAFNLERKATWLPLFALVATGFVGAIDDLWNIRGKGPNGGGMRFRDKFLIYTIIALLGSWWFYYKLEWNSIHIPALGDYTIGWWYIPVFVFTLIWMAFSSNETDGLDGLAGGIFALSFCAYAIICLAEGKTELAAFCGTIMGALLSFLWFNIPPARFFMGDTGSMALGMTLGVVAALTNTLIPLYIITAVFSLEGLSFILQFLSKKLRKGKKIFLSSPLHHHLEAIGWPEYKVTMRFWIIGAVSSAAGLMIALLGRG